MVEVEETVSLPTCHGPSLKEQWVAKAVNPNVVHSCVNAVNDVARSDRFLQVGYGSIAQMSTYQRVCRILIHTKRSAYRDSSRQLMG